MAERTFALAATPPFRLDLTALALRRRPNNGIDGWDGTTYERTLELDGVAVGLAAVQVAPPARPRIEVTVRGADLDDGAEAAARAALGRLLGLDLDLAGFYATVAGDPLLGPLAERFAGVKPPRFPTLFECLVNAIACQQLTLTVGITLLSRLAAAHGAAVEASARHAFPAPDRLAELTPDQLRPLGFSGAKARSIVELAGAVAAGELDVEAIAAADDEAAVAALTDRRGIGRWSAEYALLRGLGRLHVFPGDDVGARNNLARWLGVEGPLDYAGVRAAVARYQPYAGLVYFHLLLAGIDPAPTGEETA